VSECVRVCVYVCVRVGVWECVRVLEVEIAHVFCLHTLKRNKFACILFQALPLIFLSVQTRLHNALINFAPHLRDMGVAALHARRWGGPRRGPAAANAWRRVI